MDGEFLVGEVQELVMRIRNCPSCDAEGAQCIQFPAGEVMRCEACGLLELRRNGEDGTGASA